MATETVTGASLLGDLPPVNERAVAAVTGALSAAPKAPETAAAASAFPPDKKGRAFDAKVFRTLANGEPYRHPKTGLFMPRGGRKARAAAPVATPKDTGSAIPADLPGLSANPLSSPSPGISPASAPAEPAAVAPSRDEYDARAEGLLRGCYTAADSILRGKGEWQPEDGSEHEGMKSAYVAYAMAGGKRPMSPGWGFVLAVGGYVAKRLQMPNTMKRLLEWFPWLAGEPEPQPQKPAPAEKLQPVQQPSISTSIA